MSEGGRPWGWEGGRMGMAGPKMVKKGEGQMRLKWVMVFTLMLFGEAGECKRWFMRDWMWPIHIDGLKIQYSDNKYKITPRKMYAHCDDLFGCEVFSVQCFDQFPWAQTNAHNSQKTLRPTGVGEEGTVDSIRTLSTKKVCPKFEISFEKDFMKQHMAVFCQQYQNYIEFCANSQNQKIKISAQDLPTAVAELQVLQVGSLVQKSHAFLSCEERRQFLKDLMHEDKLNEFLNLVVRRVRSDDALWLVLVAHKVWTIYVPLQKNDYSVTDIMELAGKMCREKVWDCASNLFEESREAKGEGKEFLKVFVTTVLLTVTEYFENPYYGEKGEEEAPKRAFNLCLLSGSSEEEELQAELFCQSGVKKRKLSF